jgi:multidrug efflux pump subunit AcrA (membrane-fusion protein)
VKLSASTVLGIGLAASLFASACGDRADSMPTPRSNSVPVIELQRGKMVRSIDLPGDLVGFYEAALHAKVTGYLKTISVDKGDTIKAGQVLAEIEVPELHSNLARAHARLEIQQITYGRLKRVQKTDPRLVSQQDVDMAFANYQEAAAEVRTLETMVGYTQIIAPFEGVVTGRFADPGALIRAGGGELGLDATSGMVSPEATEGAGGHRGGGPVLTVAKIDKLRVYVYVPQGSCPLIRRGTPAVLRFDELPGRSFAGSVTRYANSLDLATRTMLTEIDIDNPGRVLYPRMYAHVSLELVSHPDALRLPVGAVRIAGDGGEVFAVRGDRLVKVAVKTGINDGQYVEITGGGLKPGETVVSAYSNTLRDGEIVKPVSVKSLDDGGKSVASGD